MLERILLGSSAGESYYLSRYMDGDGAYVSYTTSTASQVVHVTSTEEVSVVAGQNDFINGNGPFTFSQFTKDGGTVWSKRINSSTRPQVITRDASGNYYIACYVGTVAFYVFKLDSTGTLLWQRSVSVPSGVANPTGIRVDSTGANIFICGYRDASGSYFGFLVKMTSAGAHSFTRTASVAVRFLSLALDSSDNVYCVGYHGTSGGMTINKFTSAGATSFQRRFYLSTGTGTVLGYGNGIACDGTNIYVTGTFNGIQHVLELNSSGVITWSRYANLAVAYREAPACVGCDTSGNVYMGYGDGSTVFATFKFDGSGTLLWQRATNQNNFGIGGENIFVRGSNLYVGCTSYEGNGFGYVNVNKVPVDGTLTNGSSYTTSSYTVGAAPATINQATFTMTIGTTAFTVGTPTLTVSSDNMYLSKTVTL